MSNKKENPVSPKNHCNKIPGTAFRACFDAATAHQIFYFKVVVIETRGLKCRNYQWVIEQMAYLHMPAEMPTGIQVVSFDSF